MRGNELEKTLERQAPPALKARRHAPRPWLRIKPASFVLARPGPQFNPIPTRQTLGFWTGNQEAAFWLLGGSTSTAQSTGSRQTAAHEQHQLRERRSPDSDPVDRNLTPHHRTTVTSANHTLVYIAYPFLHQHPADSWPASEISPAPDFGSLRRHRSDFPRALTPACFRCFEARHRHRRPILCPRRPRHCHRHRHRHHHAHSHPPRSHSSSSC